MSIVQRIAALLRPAPSPVPSAPVTTLSASAPFHPSPLPTPPQPPQHPATALVLPRWHSHRSVYPAASFDHFLNDLRKDLAFHQRERISRETRLAELQRTPRFTP